MPFEELKHRFFESSKSHFGLVHRSKCWIPKSWPSGGKDNAGICG